MLIFLRKINLILSRHLRVNEIRYQINQISKSITDNHSTLMNKIPGQLTQYLKIKNIKHFLDDRSEEEILLSNKLVTVLGEQNINRIMLRQSLTNKEIVSIVEPALKKENFLYVCISGIHPFKNQFDSFNLPGEKLFIQADALQWNLDEESRRQKAKNTSFDSESRRLNKLIEEASRTKPIVFVYHSFGTFLVTSYMHFYGSSRVIGMIDVGGFPITLYSFLAESMSLIENLTAEEVIQNIQQITNKRNQDVSKYGMEPYKTITYLTLLMTIKQGLGHHQIFQLQRTWPNVLKCFIFGTKDQLLQQKLFSQKIVHYCYKNQLKQSESQRFIQKYKSKYNQNITNIQERFVFSVESGKHSFHMQGRFKDLMKNIASEYLEFLETGEIHPPKI